MLKGKTALITGASRGIGLAVARTLAREGAGVAMVARTAERLGEAAARIGGTAIPADIADPDGVERLVGAFQEIFGLPAPDIIVNAAGHFELAPLAEMEPEPFDQMIAVNLRGPFLITRAFLPSMLERGSGDLITIGSIAGRHAFPHNGAYSASKFGVRGLHAVLDTEVRGTGVRATLIEPAATDTPIWESIDYERHPGLPPREAMMAPEDVADTVLYVVTRPRDLALRTIIVERA